MTIIGRMKYSSPIPMIMAVVELENGNRLTVSRPTELSWIS